jgi:hypothetical protein
VRAEYRELRAALDAFLSFTREVDAASLRALYAADRGPADEAADLVIEWWRRYAELLELATGEPVPAHLRRSSE